VQHLAVEIVAPVAVDDAGQEQPRDQEKLRHPKRPGEGDRGVHPALAAGGLLDPQGGMHHHHHDDDDDDDDADPAVVSVAFTRSRKPACKVSSARTVSAKTRHSGPGDGFVNHVLGLMRVAMIGTGYM
jgi:hypothetical protein